MEINNKINKFPTYLSDSLKDILEMDKPVRNDGIIYKRFPQNKTGKFTDAEMDYLVTNQIPF